MLRVLNWKVLATNPAEHRLYYRVPIRLNRSCPAIPRAAVAQAGGRFRNIAKWRSNLPVYPRFFQG